jgi:hypothetical protein
MSKLEFFEHFIFGKNKRVKFNTSVHTTKGILEYVHADLWGPSHKKSLWMVLVTCLLLLMTTLEKFGPIS